MNHGVRSVLAAVLIMVVGILLPSDFQFENADRFVKEQSSSIQMTAQYTDGIEKKVLHDNYLRLENPREAISAQSAEQRKSTQRLPMELLLFLIFSFCGMLKESLFFRAFNSIHFLSRDFCVNTISYWRRMEKNEILLSESKNMKY